MLPLRTAPATPDREEAFPLPIGSSTPADAALRAGDAAASAYFPHPARPDGAVLGARLAAVRGLSVDRKGLSDRLSALARGWGAPAASVEAAASLARADAFLVVAGQQPGLLGGPLYVLHKIATAVALARRWNGTGLGRFVPAYWIASDDHDLAEADRISTQGADGGLRRWRLPLTDAREPLWRVCAGAEAPAWARDLLGTGLAGLPGGLAAPWVPEPQWSLPEWHGRLWLRVFGEAGLVVIEPARALWPSAGDAFARLLSAWPSARDGVARLSGDLDGRGWGSPVGPALEAPFFRVDDGPRRRLGASTPEAIRPWAQRASREPAALSPDVLARVALQNALLPVAAQVAGPHEAAYLPLSRPLHAALGCDLPVVVPRLSATWISAAQAAFLSRTGLSAASLREGKVAYEEAVASSVPAEISMHLAGAEEAFDGAISRLADVGLSLDPQLEGAFRKGRERIGQEVARLRRKVLSASLARAGLGLGDWERLRGWVSPGGDLQERVFSGVEAMARYGEEGVLAALARLDPFDFRHRVLVSREVR